MDKIKCEICGASLQKENQIFVCIKCGVQYTKDDLKNKITELANEEKSISDTPKEIVKEPKKPNPVFIKIKNILNNKNVIYPIGIICLIVFTLLFSTYLISMLQGSIRTINYNKDYKQNFFYESDAYINRISSTVLSIVLIINFITSILLVSIWKMKNRTKITKTILPIFVSTSLASSIGVLNFSVDNAFVIGLILVLTIICLFFIFELYKVRDHLDDDFTSQRKNSKIFSSICSIVLLTILSIYCLFYFFGYIQKIQHTTNNSDSYKYIIKTIIYYLLLSVIFIGMLIITSTDFFHKRKTSDINQLQFMLTCAFTALTCRCFKLIYINKTTNEIIDPLYNYPYHDSNTNLYDIYYFSFIPNFKFWFFIGFLVIAIINFVLLIYKSKGKVTLQNTGDL